MYRISDLINLPILESYEGNTVATVKNVLVDLMDRTVKSIVCREGLLNKHLCIVPMEYVIGLDKNRVLIRNKGSIKNVKQSSVESMQLLFFENITDKVIINNTGDVLGAIRDIVFEESNGKILFYEVSEGYIDDITKGRLKVECDEMLDFDKTNGIFKINNYIVRDRVQNERLDKIT